MKFFKKFSRKKDENSQNIQCDLSDIQNLDPVCRLPLEDIGGKQYDHLLLAIGVEGDYSGDLFYPIIHKIQSIIEIPDYLKDQDKLLALIIPNKKSQEHDLIQAFNERCEGYWEAIGNLQKNQTDFLLEKNQLSCIVVFGIIRAKKDDLRAAIERVNQSSGLQADANEYFKNRKYHQAINFYKAEIETVFDISKYRDKYAKLLRDQMSNSGIHPDEANFQKTVDQYLGPDWAEHQKLIHCRDFLLLGRSYFATGDYSNALENFDKAINANSTFLEAIYWKSNTLYAQNNFTEALKMYNRALDLLKSVNIWCDIGFCQKMLNNTEDAKNAFLKAFELQPSNPNIKKFIVDILN